MIIIVILVFGVIAVMDVPELIKSRYRPDQLVYCSLYLFALILSVMLVMGKSFPSPTLWFEHIIVDVLHLSYAPQ